LKRSRIISVKKKLALLVTGVAESFKLPDQSNLSYPWKGKHGQEVSQSGVPLDFESMANKWGAARENEETDFGCLFASLCFQARNLAIDFYIYKDL